MTLPRDPRAGDDAPIELELADVPRRLPRAVPGNSAGYGADARRGGPTEPPAPGAPPTGTLAPAGYVSAPAGRNLLDEPSVWPRRVFLLLVLGAVATGGYLLYRRIFRPGVVAIGSPYRSSTGVTLDLPGKTGWHSDRRGRMKQSNGDRWMRGEMVFRAAKVEEANEMAMVLRVHAPGAFSQTVDPEQLRVGLESALRQAAASAGATTKNLTCVLEYAWRSTTAVACYGIVVAPFREMPAGAYLWMHDEDDVIGIGYANADGNLGPLETMARTAR